MKIESILWWISTMGHSEISVTLNVYTHLGFEDAREEIERLFVANQ